MFGVIKEEMKKFFLFISYIIVFLSFADAEVFSREEIKTIEVQFYYNFTPVYTDTGRSIPDILNGYYEIKKTYYYDDLKDFDSLENLLGQKIEIINDDDLKRLYESFVESFCAVRINEKLVLEFTYSKSKDIYCLCNGNLIKRNKIYDNFIEYLIGRID